MVKNPFIRNVKQTSSKPLDHQSAGILDDHAQRKVLHTKHILFGDLEIGPPDQTGLGIGWKIKLHQRTDNINDFYGLGINTAEIWFKLGALATETGKFSWYDNNNVEIMNLTNAELDIKDNNIINVKNLDYSGDSSFVIPGTQAVKRSLSPGSTEAIAGLTSFLQITLAASGSAVYQWIIQRNESMGKDITIREVIFYYTLGGAGSAQITNNRWFKINITTGGASAVDDDTTALTSGTSHTTDITSTTLSKNEYIVGEITLQETGGSSSGIVQLRGLEIVYDNA